MICTYKLMIKLYPTSFSEFIFLAPLARGKRGLCHGPVSVVCACLRACVNFFFKHLLLNYWSNSDEISQECSWGEPLSNLFKFCPWDQIDPALGVTKLKICLYKAYFLKTLKIFLSITIGPRATKFGM